MHISNKTRKYHIKHARYSNGPVYPRPRFKVQTHLTICTSICLPLTSQTASDSHIIHV